MRKFNITVNGVAYEVEVEEVGAGSAPAAPVAAAPAPVAAPAPAPKAAPAPAPKAAPVAGGTKINAPMPGVILDVKAAVGASVKKGDILLVLEAMKMENEIMAPADGTVGSVTVTPGQTVQSGQQLLTIA